MASAMTTSEVFRHRRSEASDERNIHERRRRNRQLLSSHAHLPWSAQHPDNLANVLHPATAHSFITLGSRSTRIPQARAAPAPRRALLRSSCKAGSIAAPSPPDARLPRTHLGFSCSEEEPFGAGVDRRMGNRNPEKSRSLGPQVARLVRWIAAQNAADNAMSRLAYVK